MTIRNDWLTLVHAAIDIIPPVCDDQKGHNQLTN